jgi:hypothetical protein
LPDPADVDCVSQRSAFDVFQKNEEAFFCMPILAISKRVGIAAPLVHGYWHSE